MKKTKVTMSKPLYLGMTILGISKALLYKFWYDYIKPKYEDRAKLCYTDTDSFIIHIFTEDFFEDTSGDVEKWLNTSSYDENDNRLLQIGFFKDELGGGTMKKNGALRPKAYVDLMDDGSGKKEVKGTKKCVIKRSIKS